MFNFSLRACNFVLLDSKWTWLHTPLILFSFGLLFFPQHSRTTAWVGWMDGCGWQRERERQRVQQPLNLPAWAKDWEKMKKRKKKKRWNTKNQIKLFFFPAFKTRVVTSYRGCKDGGETQLWLWLCVRVRMCLWFISVYTSVYAYLLLYNYCFFLTKVVNFLIKH